MPDGPLGFIEFFVVLLFGLGWLVLELQGKRLDRKRAEREAAERDGPKAE
ncbi:MAG TPA: hypothetical protein VK216_04535 [Magnetospirillaceae bacterium]|nr:hypothetical protein [Magnetospirillaceae bacterium]